MGKFLPIKNGLTANQLKIIAIIAMTLDHFAWLFVSVISPIGQAMHIIGRLTSPIICFLLVEGYHHTKSFSNYLLRLGAFTIISAFAYTFFISGKLFPIENLSMIFTLLLGLISLKIYDSKLNSILKAIILIGLIFLSTYGDWSIFGVLFILAFHIGHYNKKLQIFNFAVVGFSWGLSAVISAIINNEIWYFNLFQFAVLLSIPFLMLYNGKKGTKNHFGKWFFYIYYPLHLIIIKLIKLM